MYIFIRDIATFVSGFLTPLIAAIAVYIAWQQWKTAKQKIAIDLYDKRLRIYEEIVKVLSIIIRDADISYEELAIFRSSVAEADFILGPEIVSLIDEIYTRGIHLHSYNEEYNRNLRTSVPEYNHQKTVDGKHEELVWLISQLEGLKGKFIKYMGTSK